MIKLRHFLYATVSIPLILILIWFFAVPDELIKEKIEDTVAQSGNKNLNIEIHGLRKGFFFSLHADRLILKADNIPAIEILDFRCFPAPRYIINRQIAATFRGIIGQGQVNGIIKFPLSGKIDINNAELGSIPYLSQLGEGIRGSLSSNIQLQRDKIKATFEIPDLDIQNSSLTIIPLIDTFHRIQGSISVVNNAIRFDSVGLEGEKGYARLKGNIINRFMDMELEIMPAAGSLNATESMLIGKYIVSPGYYIIPIRGPLP